MEAINRKWYRIRNVKALTDARIQVEFINGQWVTVDFHNLPYWGDITGLGNLPGRLADDEYLAQVKIGDYGHWLEWPGELDFGADQLWEWGTQAEPQPVSAEPARRQA